MFNPATFDRMICFADLGRAYLSEAIMQGEGFVYSAIAERKGTGFVWLFAELLRVLEREACFRDPIMESWDFLGNSLCLGQEHVSVSKDRWAWVQDLGPLDGMWIMGDAQSFDGCLGAS